MSKLYACVISPDLKRDRNALLATARRFSYSIEVIDDGVMFDVSGLERLVGGRETIAQAIADELKITDTPGSIAVAETPQTAKLLARQSRADGRAVHSPDAFPQLPLRDLDIEQDTLNVFADLGIRNVEDLLAIPKADLINRYGREFERVIRTITQQGDALLTPNLKEDRVAWNYALDLAVEDFEQLIFILNHGLDSLFARIARLGLSTEHLDISFRLSNKTTRNYEIRTSFPTLERPFWLKLINLRVSLDPPEAAIASMAVTAHFTRPRPSQSGLYAVSRPTPESLTLTLNKLKKLVGEKNVGTPRIVDQRLAQPFTLDADAAPQGKETHSAQARKAIVAFKYFRPPLRADVLVRDRRILFVKTRQFSGRVAEYSGVWKTNSKWWDRPWKVQEWDIEIENDGVYRLCKAGKEWFVVGEYD